MAGGFLPSLPAAATTPTAAAKPAPSTPGGGVHSPDTKFGEGWKSSQDRAVTSAADTGGFKLLVSDGSHAYAWKTAAVLSEPGLPADSFLSGAFSEIVWKWLATVRFVAMVLAVREVLLQLEELIFLSTSEIRVVSVQEDGNVI
ncbi:hypothetical protein [Streptomyces drozdowiczii]|uniref:hypothetical protein n=1 Tax=Streptomyces drozdowiczii TaxID=202862 RepID=UPI002246DC34|nr:hypothetical protein [Streptomyces drozdowiczii]MCX0241918.1 hypothetical protein [Streptomyces drozdowiczii]